MAEVSNFFNTKSLRKRKLHKLLFLAKPRFQVLHCPNLVTESCAASIKPLPSNFIVEFNRKSNQKYALEIDLPLMAAKINVDNYTVIELLNSYYDLRHHCYCGQNRGLTSYGIQMVTVVCIPMVVVIWLLLLILLLYRRDGRGHRHVELTEMTSVTVSLKPDDLVFKFPLSNILFKGRNAKVPANSNTCVIEEK